MYRFLNINCFEMSDQQQGDQEYQDQEEQQEQPDEQEQEDGEQQPLYKKPWFIATIVVIIVLVVSLCLYFFVFRNKGNRNAPSEMELMQRRMMQQQAQERRIQEEVSKRLQAEQAAKQAAKEDRKRIAREKENELTQKEEETIRNAYRKEMSMIGQEVSDEDRQSMVNDRTNIINDVLYKRMKRMRWFESDIKLESEKFNLERIKEQGELELARLNTKIDTDNNDMLEWERADRMRQAEKTKYEAMIENELRRLHGIAEISQEITEDLSDDEE
jgi:flagellar basal body-associated protein FliL